MSSGLDIPALPPIIAGTAGHVDHGKTALVKLLTGCDTDRLKEEKERGLSINLGFAPCRLTGNRVIGMIDVPGHIDFIRNMVAGAASIDVLILVVAADDGIMPQTVEHMQIVKLLAAPEVIVALTKKDLVDEETLELAKDDVCCFMQSVGYTDVPIIPVSNVTLEGISAFREALDEAVNRFQRRYSQGVFRMSIQRLFTVKGYGTVVTGIPNSGHAEVGEALEVLPGGRRVRIRAVQSYKFDKEIACANTCCALNISDVRLDELSRGMVLAEPGAFQATGFCFVAIRNVHNVLALKHNMQYRFYSGTAEVKVKVKLIGKSILACDEQGVAGLVFDMPVVVAPGDKFIIRNMSPSQTVAGGTVLCEKQYRYKRSDQAFQKRLCLAAEFADSGSCLKAALLAAECPVVNTMQLQKTALVRDDEYKGLVQELVDDSFITPIDSSIFVVAGREKELVEQLVTKLKLFHEKYPYTWGITYQDALQFLAMESAEGKAFLQSLITTSDKLKMQYGRIALKGFSPALSRQQMIIKDRMVEMIVQARCEGVSVHVINDTLKLGKAELKLFTRILLEENAFMALGKQFIAEDAFAECVDAVRGLCRQIEYLQVSDFRSRVKTGRNMAVAILEKMDELGITKRVEQGRVLLA